MCRYKKREQQRHILKQNVRRVTFLLLLLFCLGILILTIDIFAYGSNFLSQKLRHMNVAKQSIVFPNAYPYPNKISDFIPRVHKRILLICHPDWHGIRQATYAQAESMSLPVLLFSTIEAQSQQEKLLAFLLEYRIKLLIINGVPPGTMSFGKFLKSRESGISVVFIWHGQPSRKQEAAFFEELILGVEQERISHLAFVKPGLNLLAKNVFKTKNNDMKYIELENWPEPFHTKIDSLKYSRADIFTPFSDVDGRIHVGVFGWDLWIKNLANQIPAVACMFSDNVVLHVLKTSTKLPNWEFVRHCEASIIQHEQMENEYFSTILSRMDINMYVTISEASPMVPLESVSAGIPCLVGPSAILYNKDPYLHKILVVNDLDRPDVIANQLKQAMKERDEIKTRLPAIMKTMYNRAFKLWDNFLTLYDINIRHLQLPKKHISFEFKKSVTPRNINIVIRQHQNNVQHKKSVYCYCSYELEGVVSGGAGVLITALAFAHLKAGNNVILLIDLPHNLLVAWKQRFSKNHPSLGGHLSLYALENIANQGKEEDEFMRKSTQWAHGVKAVYNIAPFDMVEFFEYAGAAFEVINCRSEYLPQEVKIVVRIHGSLMLIDLASDMLLHKQKLSSLSNSFQPLRQRMYFMEKFSLQNADLIIAPSQSMGKLYQSSYQMRRDNLVIGPPCMQEMLLQLKNGALMENDVAVLPPPNLLFYGSLQMVKGVSLIVDAFLSIIKMKKYRHAQMIFVGIDRICPSKDGACLLKDVEEKFRSNFRFYTKRVERKSLGKFQNLVRAAILPSMFETFCISAHEIYSLKIPMIVSDIPAFRDFFNNENALVFRSGSSNGLVEHMQYVLDMNQNEYEQLKEKMVSLEYKEPLDVYSPHNLRDHKSIKPRDKLASVIMNM